MSFRSRLATAGMVAVVALAGCDHARPVDNSEYTSPTSQDSGTNSGPTAFDSTLKIGVDKNAKAKPEESGLGINAYLWRGTLDTLAFMPLASADPFGGVIITDWWQPTVAPDERFKITAYILGRTLRADGIKVSIFRQIHQGGEWSNAPVAPGTIAEIEDKILARSRELRSQSAQQ